MGSSFKAAASDTPVQHLSYKTPVTDYPVLSSQLGQGFTNTIMLDSSMSITNYQSSRVVLRIQ